MGNFTNLPAALVDELQTGFLEREFEEGLDSQLAYRREALQETVPARIGETITRTRTGRKAPVTTPINVANNVVTDLNNGLTASDAANEQYTLTMQQFADLTAFNLMDDLATIANNLVRISRNNGVQASQSIERLARLALFNAYMGGNSRVRTDLGGGGTTTCHCDDIRGFQTVVVNGVITPVSSGNPLTVYETAVAGNGVTQTLTVTGAAADGTNHSSVVNTAGVVEGISGVLTFSVATTPVNGDALVSGNAPKVLRPFSHITTAQMTGADLLTFGLVQDATAYLRSNGVPPMDDGTYHILLDNVSMRQLYSDQDFKVALAGRLDTPEYRNQDVVRLFGQTFVPTTEALIQNASTSGASGVSANSVGIRRPIVLGAEVLIEGDFEGMEQFLNREGMSPIGSAFMVDGVVQIMTPPLDALQQWAKLAWDWIGGFAVPTDLTATPSIIASASSSLFKRACIIETSA
jgi:hypothetical protein